MRLYARRLLRCMEETPVALSMVSRGVMSRLNWQHRQVRGSTDTLAFPLEGGDCLGHIYLCWERALHKRFPWWLPQVSMGAKLFHLRRLLAHSLAHLQGYDHQTLGEYRRMLRHEHHLIRRTKFIKIL